MYRIKNSKELENLIEYTNLNNLVTDEEMEEFLNKALELNFKSIVINPSYLDMAKDILGDSDTEIITVVGFPLGFETTDAKVKEAELAIENGADGVEMVINLSDVKNGKFDDVQKEAEEVKKAIGDKSLKIIIETKALEDSEKMKIAQALEAADVDYIATSTGFVNPNTIYEDVTDITLLKKYAPKTKVKVSGWITDYKFVNQLLTGGADLIGSVEGYEIVKDYQDLQENTKVKPKPITLN